MFAAALNPIIYGVVNKNIRLELGKLRKNISAKFKRKEAQGGNVQV